MKHEWGISGSPDGPRICRNCGAIEGYALDKGFVDNMDDDCPEVKPDEN